MNIDFLIIDSIGGKKVFFLQLFEELSERGLSFCFLARRKQPVIEARKWLQKKAYLGPRIGSFSGWLFILLIPALRTIYLFYLAYFKLKRKTKAVVCLGLNEKILLAPIARLLKLKLIWLERPEAIKKRLPFLARLLYRANLKKVRVVAVSSLVKARLMEMGVKETQISLIPPSIRIKKGHQNDIYSQLAEESGSKFKKKFFTIGTVADLDHKQQIENLLHTVKICTEVIPNIQLIVVGDGLERKNLAWSAKKMGIDTLVWFVGEHGHMRKWLESFDIFVPSVELMQLSDMEVVLKCMAAGLPVIAPLDQGLEDLVEEDKTGYLLKTTDSEMLARRIIKLYQDKRLCRSLGQAGKERAEAKFNILEHALKLQSLI